MSGSEPTIDSSKPQETPQSLLVRVKNMFVQSGVPQQFIEASEAQLPFFPTAHYGTDLLTEFTSPAGLFFVQERDGHLEGVMSVSKSSLSTPEKATDTLVEEYTHYLHAANNPQLQEKFKESAKRQKMIAEYEGRRASDVEIRNLFGLEEDTFGVLNQYIDCLTEVNGIGIHPKVLNRNILICSFGSSNITGEESFAIAQELADRLQGTGENYGYIGTGETLSLQERIAYIKGGEGDPKLADRYRTSIYYGLSSDIQSSVEARTISLDDLQSILEAYGIEPAKLLGTFTSLKEELLALSDEDKVRYLTVVADKLRDQIDVEQITNTLRSLTEVVGDERPRYHARKTVSNPQERLADILQDIDEGRRAVSSIINDRVNIGRVLIESTDNSIRKQFKDVSLKSIVLESVAMARNEWDAARTVQALSDPNFRRSFVQSVIDNTGGFFPNSITFNDFMTREGWYRVHDSLSARAVELGDEDFAFIDNLLQKTWWESYGVEGGKLTPALEIHRNLRSNSSLVDAYSMQQAKLQADLVEVEMNMLTEPIAKIIKYRITKGSLPTAQQISKDLDTYKGFRTLNRANKRPAWMDKMIVFVGNVYDRRQFGRLREFFQCKSFSEQTVFLDRYIPQN
ncbi:hypothetical protein A2Z00_02105 [Candidatus Gottesmanbacteria bacterium RBG_13_45_10]|uniref:Uncharacterized protein n=1 Tax=Candidatus Gottesmanbacteria bacterium RBG_13_45_10 TaxID=1798370 RepID=A0A1F5ZG13_9BACT|nr:MAG: hypothetical protein A2Z00_02105 [Candidatus Gottesmanbacteria bacterium RBG_13_45_10]